MNTLNCLSYLINTGIEKEGMSKNNFKLCEGLKQITFV